MKKLTTLLLAIIFLSSCSVTKLESPPQKGSQANMVYKNYSSKYALNPNYSYTKHDMKSTVMVDSTKYNKP